MKSKLIVIMVLIVLVGVVMTASAKIGKDKDAKKAIELKTEQQKVGYAIGTQIGNDFNKNGLDIDLDAFLRGFSDAFTGKDLAMTEPEARQVLEAFGRRMQEEQQKKMAEQGTKNIEAGQKFLDANKKKKGVVVLPSGLQYKVIKKGTGATPAATDSVKVHYRGTLIDGTEFDSSYKRGDEPTQLDVNRVIKGWVEALQLMKEGAKWELYIPSDLAYGPQGPPNIGADATLVFEIELVELVKK